MTYKQQAEELIKIIRIENQLESYYKRIYIMIQALKAKIEAEGCGVTFGFGSPCFTKWICNEKDKCINCQATIKMLDEVLG